MAFSVLGLCTVDDSMQKGTAGEFHTDFQGLPDYPEKPVPVTLYPLTALHGLAWE
jgi:hypothetical protein